MFKVEFHNNHSLRHPRKVGLYLLDLFDYSFNRTWDKKYLRKLQEMYRDDVLIKLKIHWADKISYGLIGLFLGAVFIILAEGFDILLLGFCLLLPLLMFLLPDYELNKALQKRRQVIILEFPDFLNKITLLINAGMTLPRAWDKIAHDNRIKSLFYGEVERVTIEIEGGMSIYQAYENFALRCRDPQVIRFVTAVLQNLRKGNDELVHLLKLQTNECFENRKHIARRLGEEASTKLLLPMMLMFAAILLIVVTPAILAIRGL